MKDKALKWIRQSSVERELIAGMYRRSWIIYILQYYSVDLKADNGDESKKEEEYQDRQSAR